LGGYMLLAPVEIYFITYSIFARFLQSPKVVVVKSSAGRRSSRAP
jgi:hypothetical protein